MMLDLHIKGDFQLDHFVSGSSGKTARVGLWLQTDDEATLRAILDELARVKNAQNTKPKPSRTARFYADLLPLLKNRKI